MVDRRRRAAVAALGAAIVAVSLPWACGYLLPQLGTFPLGLAALAGYSPYLLVPLLVLAALLRTWPVALLAVALLVAQGATLAPAYVGDDVGVRRPVLTVMSANLLFGQADAGQVVRLVRERRVDVLALEELTPAEVTRLRSAGLEEQLPFSVNRAAGGAAGTGLWSRLPLREVPSRVTTFAGCAGEVSVGGRTVRVRAVHTVPPVGGTTFWRHDFLILRAQAADDQAVPTMLLGDFNASVHHRELRRLRGDRWRDAAEVAGAGLVRTWTPGYGLPALLDPDHVLVDRGMRVRRWDAVTLRGSDHRAVVAEVGI